MNVKFTANGFIPELVEKSKNDLLLLYFKFFLCTVIILVMIYFIAVEITIVRNQGGYKKAIFWVILIVLSLLENYIFFFPFLCFIKTKILINFGSFDTHTSLFCSIRTWLYGLLITDIDRAIYKEFCEYIKVNTSKDDFIDEEIAQPQETINKATEGDASENDNLKVENK